MTRRVGPADATANDHSGSSTGGGRPTRPSRPHRTDTAGGGSVHRTRPMASASARSRLRTVASTRTPVPLPARLSPGHPRPWRRATAPAREAELARLGQTKEGARGVVVDRGRRRGRAAACRLRRADVRRRPSKTKLSSAVVSPRTGTTATTIVITVTLPERGRVPRPQRDRQDRRRFPLPWTASRAGRWGQGVTFSWSGTLPTGSTPSSSRAQAKDKSEATLAAGDVTIARSRDPDADADAQADTEADAQADPATDPAADADPDRQAAHHPHASSDADTEPDRGQRRRSAREGRARPASRHRPSSRPRSSSRQRTTEPAATPSPAAAHRGHHRRWRPRWVDRRRVRHAGRPDGHGAAVIRRRGARSPRCSPWPACRARPSRLSASRRPW